MTFILNKYLGFVFLILLASCILTGCPAKVDPGQSAESGYKTMSKSWGLPMVHAFTWGFNGSISQPNFTGPANTNAPAPASK